MADRIAGSQVFIERYRICFLDAYPVVPYQSACAFSSAVEKLLDRGISIDTSCAPSSPAGPAWLEPCRDSGTAQRRHHRQPRHRAGRETLEHLLDHPRVTFIEGGITDLDLLMETFAGADAIFHQAAIPSVPWSVKNPLASNEANVTGTVSVLVAAENCGVPAPSRYPRR